MPFTVLKTHKTEKGNVEVAGEFPDEDQAQQFIDAEQLKADGEDHPYEYALEAPPTPGS